MCNYPEESNTGHADEKRIQPQQSPELKKTNEAIDKCVDDLMETSNVDISLMMDDYKESLAESEAKRQEGALTQKGAEFLGIRLTEEEAKANGDLQLKFGGFIKELEAEQKKCPMAEAEDQEIEDMCSARRIIPDEQPTDQAEEPVDVPAEQTVGQPIAESNFSAQEESAIMAEVDKRVAEISNQMQAEYAEKRKKHIEELDKHCDEYLAKKENSLLEHFDEVSKKHQAYLDDEQHKTLNEYFKTLWSCWGQLPNDVKVKLGGIDFVKKNAAKAEQESNAAHLNNELNYDAESLVDSIGKKYKENFHISDEDLSTLASDPSMLTNFILHYVPMAERSKFELTLQALKEQHPEMQWNVQALNIEDGGTMNFCGLPNMSDTVLSSSNEKVCTVADIYETQLKHYKEANDSMQIGTKLDPKNVSYWDAQIPPPKDQRKVATQQDQCKVARQCAKPEGDWMSASQPAVRMLSKNMLDDLPKSMVDKIISISNEYWSHESDGEVFDLGYSYLSRYINIQTDFSACTESSDKPFLVLKYRNSGLGSIQYKRIFKTVEEFMTAGSNAKRLYAWLAMVIDAFYNK